MSAAEAPPAREMKDAETIRVRLHETAIGFDAARRKADEKAGEQLKEPLLVAWYDGGKGIGHPDVHECTDKPGWMTYAESRGGSITVDVNDGRYILIYAEGSLE